MTLLLMKSLPCILYLSQVDLQDFPSKPESLHSMLGQTHHFTLSLWKPKL